MQINVEMLRNVHTIHRNAKKCKTHAGNTKKCKANTQEIQGNANSEMLRNMKEMLRYATKHNEY